MEKLYITLIGLSAGAIGYLITNFWFHPILRYRDIRSQILSDLVFYANAINADGLNETMKERLNQRIEANRRHSADLAANYMEMPSWYKTYLKRKEIFPAMAATEILGLSNTYERESAEKRVEKIQRLLKIEPRVV